MLDHNNTSKNYNKNSSGSLRNIRVANQSTTKNSAQNTSRVTNVQNSAISARILK